ncbi:MAG: alkane 1-monooxygenase, partial [Pseudomonadota bacterium]
RLVRGMVLYRFAIATLTPALLIALAVGIGAQWGWAAIVYMTVLVFGMDKLIGAETEKHPPEMEFPAADALLKVLAGSHFFLLGLCLYAMLNLTGSQLALTLICSGLVFGQISHPAAHELIHKKSSVMRLLGRLIYSSLLVGHHASAHVRVHHMYVGSDEDPNSPRAGEGFYRYAWRASKQSFLAGLRAENRTRRKKPSWSHPYALYVAVGLATLAVFVLTAGTKGMLLYGLVALHAQMQILMSDYVQHYGLRRQTMPNGDLEPVGPQHSWNAPHWFSSSMMLNATRHSDHHVNPRTPYPALKLSPGEMPMMPYPLPVMGTIALMPHLWRALMEKRAEKWVKRPWHMAKRNGQEPSHLTGSNNAKTPALDFNSLARTGSGAG